MLAIKKQFIFILTCFFILSSLGCVPLGLKNAEEKMQSRLNLYEAISRWGSIKELYGFLKVEEDKAIIIPQNLDDIRVVSYNVLTKPLITAEGHMEQTISIEYVRSDEQRVKKIIDHQYWQRESDATDWFRLAPIPLFE